MARKINSIQLLQNYFSDVMIRTDHHALGVSQVALAVIGGIIWKSSDIEVFERNGEAKNVLWMQTPMANFYFSYDHATDEIVVKENNHKGRELIRFTNTSPIADIHAFFDSM